MLISTLIGMEPVVEVVQKEVVTVSEQIVATPKTATSKLKKFFKTLGPGLITGASDDDPSGIATYSQTGAQFGYGQLWTALFSFPLMTAVQEMCARIGLVTGEGLAGVIRRHYNRQILYVAVALLCVANAINIGADLGAMAAAVQLFIPDLPFLLIVGLFTVLILILEIFMPYKQYARVLKFLTFALFAYFVTAFFIKESWLTIISATFVPRNITFDQSFLMNIVAILGTTISPYLYFWQTNEEVEEQIESGLDTLKSRQGTTKRAIQMMHTDVFSGMLLSNIVMWFIIVTTAGTLYANGIHTIESAPQAAEALRPFAGDLAYALFALGIIGTGLLAIPILSGSAAYALSEAFHWKEGLSLKFRKAHGFYGVIIISVLVGLVINFLHINPIRMLYYTAVINGIIAPPLLWLILKISNNKEIMGIRTNSRLSNILGWLTFIAMTVAAVLLISSWFIPS